MKKILYLPIVLFLVAIWLPMLQMTCQFYSEFQDTENRDLAKLPEWNTTPLSQLSHQYEVYIGDHFGFRPDLIHWNSFLRVHLLGVSPIPSVVLGKDPWLFYCSEVLADGNSINDHMGLIPLPDTELEKLRLQLEDNNRKFQEHGITYIVVIAPNKNTIYPEFLPELIGRWHSRTRLDQFYNYMEDHSALRVIDLRKALLRAKEALPVYLETDSHWNTYGAYVGYIEIMKRIREYYPEAEPAKIAGEVGIEEHRKLGGDLAYMLLLPDLKGERNHTRINLDPQQHMFRLPKIVFRHDSFGDNLYAFLSRNFEKILGKPPFTPFRFEEIFPENPEIVLHVFAERYLTQAIHDDFFYREGSSAE
jgi:alginate O-acetyltransferase complex protein AlgJ